MLIHPLLINQPMTWVIILLVVLVLFGATRLPALSKSLGQSVKIFRKEVTSDEHGDTAAAPSTTATSTAAPASAVTPDTAAPVTPVDPAPQPTDKS